jgi:hypothetical protein
MKMRTGSIKEHEPPLHGIILGELGHGKTTLCAQATHFSECVWAITDPNTLPTLMALGIDVEYDTFVDTSLSQPTAFNRLVDFIDTTLSRWAEAGELNSSKTFVLDGITGLLPIAMNRALVLKGLTPKNTGKGRAKIDTKAGDPLGYYKTNDEGLVSLRSISDLGDYNVMGAMVKHLLTHLAIQTCNVFVTAHIVRENDKAGHLVEDICTNKALKQEIPSRFTEAWVVRAEDVMREGELTTVRTIDTRPSVSRYARTAYEHILDRREKAYLPYLRDKIIAGMKQETGNTVNKFDPGDIEIDQNVNFLVNAGQKAQWAVKEK